MLTADPDPDHISTSCKTVVEQHGAAIGALITMQEPTKAMREAAASAGFYHSDHWGKDYPRMQLLTVEQLLAGQGITYPPTEKLTFKAAPKARAQDGTEQLPL